MIAIIITWPTSTPMLNAIIEVRKLSLGNPTSLNTLENLTHEQDQKQTQVLCATAATQR